MSHTRYVRATFQLVLLISMAGPAFTGDVSGWRTDGTGYYADADPPRTWSDEKNVAWKTELPGRSHSSPVVSGNRVFVCSDPAELLSLNVSDGEVLWQKSHEWSDVFPPEKVAEIEESYAQADLLEKQRKEIHTKFDELRKADPEGNKTRIEELKEQAVSLELRLKALLRYPPPRRGASGNSAATPVTDGSIVVALFGTGVVSARTKLSARWGTPVATAVGETPVIVSPAGSIIRAKDGVQLASKLFGLGNNSPIVAGNIVYAMEPGKFKALRLPDTVADQLEVELLWEASGTRQRSFAAPVLHNGQVFSVTESGIFEVTDAATSKMLERRRMEFEKGRVYASVTAAAGLVFVGCESGETSVMNAGGDFEEVARNRCEGYSSCPVFAGKRAFLSTRSHLYCISEAR